MMRLSSSDLQATLMLSLNPTNSGDMINHESRKVDLDALLGDPALASSNDSSDDSMSPLTSQDAGKPRLAEDIFKAAEDRVADDLSPQRRLAQDPWQPADAETMPSPALEPQNNGNGHGSANGLESLDSTPTNHQAPEPEQGFFPVLKNRNFLTLWSGQVFSQLADKVYLVLMIALIASRFQSDDQSISGWVSSIMIAFTIPAVLFGSIAGVFVDRWSKKTVLVLTNLLRGGLVFALPPLLWLSKGWSPLAGLPVGFCVLLGITFLVSTLTQFFAPAEQSTLPLVVERRHLLSANSLYTTTMMASVIIGFAVGEPLLALADTLISKLGWTAIGLGKELVVASGYTIAGVILLWLRTGEKSRLATNATEEAIDAEAPHVWQDIRDGLRFLAEQGRVRSALIQLVILFSVFAALAVLSVRLAEVTPEIKSSQFGFLLAMGGVGMAIGATFIGQFGQRFPHTQLSLVGSLGMAASLFGISLSVTRLIPTLLLIAALGGFAAVVGVPMQTAIQEETPEAMRGKVFGLQNNAINIALSLPLALAGVAETFFGLRAVFIGLAVLVVAGGVLTWYISRTGLNQR
ncbi:MFS transporter [Phormidium sp. FACHB-592]|uniref:MFS transporter n=1 Tax=Stenomitos frigidus AS-A4 TaxID=2933935 RepID=A0ABV0KM93_9CYAN|nr:MFS transporter [Phormidium sp. FACHB-592]MBD2072481.1 MFS transporter [Phormidium sp. FACHB-592]